MKQRKLEKWKNNGFAHSNQHLSHFAHRAMYFGMYDTIMECVRPEYSHKVWIEFPAAEFSGNNNFIVLINMMSELSIQRTA